MAMVKIANEVLEKALELPDADRLEIASRLFASVSPDVANVSDDLWMEELHRRRQEYLDDPSTGVSWSELKAETGER